MVGCFYDFGQCFLQPDGCSLKLPPTWSHRSPCAKVVWGLEAQVHGPFSTFHRGWKPWVMVDPEVVDPNNKKEIWNDGWYGHEKKLGYLEASGTLLFFLLLVILKVPTKQFWCQWFWSSAIIVFDQEINDDTPYLFFTISGDLLVRVILYLSFYVHFDQGNAIVYPAMKWCQTDLWPNLPDRKCCHASYLQLEIRKNTVEVRTKRIEIYVYLQCISTIIW